MKKLYIFALVAMLFAACTTDAIDEQSVKVEEQTPDTLVGTFEGDDSRIQLQNGKTVWTKGDEVSVFYLSNANQKWQYQGETGERTGNLKRANVGNATETMKRVVVVYPYNENYYINTDTYNVKASLPATQTYLKDSYGLDGNIMVSQSEYNQFSLRNVCGWLKIQLTGNGEKVKSIKLKGNNGEQVAGEIYINSATAEATLAAEMGGADDNENSAGGNLVFDDTILTEVALDCGEGVELGSEPTAFYIALPPQTFERGLTIEVESVDGEKMTKSTDKEVVISRNAIQPMESFLFRVYYTPSTPTPASNEIWYTSSDGNIVVPKNIKDFGSNIVSNTYTDGVGVLVFEKEISKIADSAFSISRISSITLPDGIIEIGNSAFHECYSMTEITIPNGVRKLGYGAFASTNIMIFNLPDSITEIGAYAFEGCNITSFSVPSNLTTIGEGVFHSCHYLQEFNGKFASLDCRCLIMDNSLVAFAPYKLTSYSIPYGVESICDSAFYGCSELENIYIPNTVTHIGVSAFSNCGISTINLPSSITEIEQYMFFGCEKLTSIVIPNNVESIRHDAFSSCSNLISITIPESVKWIESSPFVNCEKLAEFRGQYASSDGRCLIVDGELVAFAPHGIIGYNIPDNVTKIGYDTFRGNSNLKSVVIPESVEYIAAYVFQDCSNLSNVYCASAVPPQGDDGIFANNASDRKIYVPRESVEAYKSAQYWSDYADSIVGYDF